jgi:site-specific DNA recombinase
VTRQDQTTAIYVRTAVRNPTGDQSLAIQEQACRTYAAERGWHALEVFADEGIAGTQRDHPGLNRLLTAARDRVVERVLIVRPDRLSRGHTAIKAIVDELEARGVECVSVEQPTHLRGQQLTGDAG